MHIIGEVMVRVLQGKHAYLCDLCVVDKDKTGLAYNVRYLVEADFPLRVCGMHLPNAIDRLVAP